MPLPMLRNIQLNLLLLMHKKIKKLIFQMLKILMIIYSNVKKFMMLWKVLLKTREKRMSLRLMVMT